MHTKGRDIFGNQYSFYHSSTYIVCGDGMGVEKGTFGECHTHYILHTGNTGGRSGGKRHRKLYAEALYAGDHGTCPAGFDSGHPQSRSIPDRDFQASPGDSGRKAGGQARGGCARVCGVRFCDMAGFPAGRGL